MRIWNESTILDALTRLTIAGEAVVSCETPASANRFRTAIYNYRRRKNLPGDIQISISGVDVILHRPKIERATLKA